MLSLLAGYKRLNFSGCVFYRHYLLRKNVCFFFFQELFWITFYAEGNYDHFFLSPWLSGLNPSLSDEIKEITWWELRISDSFFSEKYLIKSWENNVSKIKKKISLRANIILFQVNYILVQSIFESSISSTSLELLKITLKKCLKIKLLSFIYVIFQNLLKHYIMWIQKL